MNTERYVDEKDRQIEWKNDDSNDNALRIPRTSTHFEFPKAFAYANDTSWTWFDTYLKIMRILRMNEGTSKWIREWKKDASEKIHKKNEIK